MDSNRENFLKIQFENIYSQYARKIYNYVYSRLLHRESAEDVTSEIFIKVIQNLNNYDEKKAMVSTWLVAIARNAVNDYMKKASFRRENSTDEISNFVEDRAQSYNPHDTPSLKDPTNEKLYNILIHLSDDERDFLELRYGLELKNKEIADMLGISVKAVDNRYRRLLDKCRNIADAKKNSSERTPINLNKNADTFKNYLDEKNITAFEIETLDDEQATTVFSSYVIIAGQRLPTAVILDQSIFALIRVQVAQQILSEENQIALLKFINEENVNYKPFKLYFNKDGTLFLDLCIPIEKNLSGDMIYLMFNVIINYLETSYKKIMKIIWQ